MPDKEGYGGISKEKLLRQLKKARGIVRIEEMNDTKTSHAYHHARQIVLRTEKLLGVKEDDEPKAGKAKKERKRGKPIIPELKKVEEATRKAAALSAVARRGNKD